MLVVMVLSFQAFVQRVPFDIAEAETEIMEGPLMEYSGPKLALFKYAQMVKLVIYSALVRGAVCAVGIGLPFPLGWLLFWAKVWRWCCWSRWWRRLTRATGLTRRSASSPLLAVAFGALVLAAYGF